MPGVKLTGTAKLLLLTGLLVLFGAGLVQCSRGNSESPMPWTRTLADAKSKAANGNKLIIADIYTDWCGWCKEMDVKTWAHPSVIQESDKHVFLKLNAETEDDGVALQKKFGIQSYPMVMLLDSKGDEFDRLEGYLPAEQFLEKLKSTLADPNALGNLKAQAAKEPDNLDLVFKLGKKLFGRYDFQGAQTRFERIVEQDPGNKSQLVDSALFYLALCQASQTQTDRSLATIDHLRKTYPESKFVANSYLLSAEILVRLGKKDAARTRLESFLKTYPDHQLVDQAKKLLAEI